MRFCFELYFLGKIPLSLKPRWYYCPCSPPAAEYALALYAISDSQLSRDGLGHLLKGWIVRGTTSRRLPYWAKGLFYPSWNKSPNLQLVGGSVADCQALT